jgi:metallophosphoesterase (TIGR00282 family)
MASMLRFLFVGDIIGAPGIAMFQKWAPRLKEQFQIDSIVVNGENSMKNGMGLNVKTVELLRASGAALVTTGNHVWDQKDLYAALNERDDIIRPANYPPGMPGKSHVFLNVQGHQVAVVNLHGRVYSKDNLDCPFRTIDSLLTFLKSKTNLIFVDFHADATSEKRAMGMFLDGRVSGVFGTHTHIQTADHMIQRQGTSYITDLGGCGALHSVLGMHYDGMLPIFLQHRKMGKIAVEEQPPFLLSGVIVDIDTQTGKALKIEPVRIVDHEIAV